MVEMERDQKLKNLLVGKTPVSELFDPTNKTSGSPRRVTRSTGRTSTNFSWNELKKIKVKEDDGLAARWSSASRSSPRSRSASTTRC